MGRDMKGTGTKTGLKATALIHGLTQGSTKGTGKTTTCMAREHTPGQMAGSMREAISWIRSTGSEYMRGLTGGAMRGIG